MRKNNNGVSAVIGVILMVAITVAIAATVWVYVSGMLEDREEPVVIDDWNSVNITGRLNGFWGNGWNYTISIGNQTFERVDMSEKQIDYLEKFIGSDITIMLDERITNTSRWGKQWNIGEYNYKGAYLSEPLGNPDCGFLNVTRINDTTNELEEYIPLFYYDYSFAGWLYNNTFYTMDESPFDMYVHWRFNSSWGKD